MLMDKKLLIMVIEDEEMLLQAISKKLALDNIDTVTCSSAEQAVDYLNNISEIPNGIWLDYHLKGMDGLEFLKILKENENWKGIPVMVVSNSANDSTVKNILALGADKYILKAKYRLDEIIVVLREVVEKN
jgi:CheY-like chemotaxis protein